MYKKYKHLDRNFNNSKGLYSKTKMIRQKINCWNLRNCLTYLKPKLEMNRCQ